MPKLNHEQSSIEKPTQHPGNEVYYPMPDICTPPYSPLWGVVAGGAQGYRAQPMGWLEASQRGHGTNLKPKHTHPKFGAAGRVPGQID